MSEQIYKVEIPKRALIFGRFQPFHLGHLYVIKWALERFDELVLLVGMADESHTLRNPFTAGERIWMIREGLKEAGIDLSRIITATVPTMSVYVGHALYIINLVPQVKAIITRNPVIAKVFEDAGLEVVIPPEFDRSKFRGTHIRKLMLEDGSWEELVPRSVERIVKYLGGVERLKIANSRD
ncbi:MAG: nicotinamide-nucleotide adenylyltransferase [Archaeoglobaceae archaeon]|nr:nicotinamide-nucleotide adenylyltransferase [Archaeoglobaceae archaeon]MCX8151718.1 nicotinamide-nucleotide adenylyltransferase [Archaeoglobaceae archaeon]MDW8013847.1 nicotinamide-nucleotide adenylyltransferase [Archaeoglobaceae archaeon]